MMGRTHVAVSSALYCTTFAPRSLEEIPTWSLGFGVAVLSALLPDLDEPRSRIGGLLFPVIPPFFRPVVFCLVGTYLAYEAFTNRVWWLLAVGLALLFLVFIRHRESPTHGLIGLGLVMSLVYSWDPAFTVPVLIGYGSHLVLDIITEGVSLFWPIRMRIRIPLTSTNSLLEKWLVYRGAQVWMLVIIVQLVFQEVLQPIKPLLNWLW